MEISLKLVKVKTGEVLAASEVSIAASGVVASMLRRPLTATVRVEVEPAGAVGTASVGGVRRELLAGERCFARCRKVPAWYRLTPRVTRPRAARCISPATAPTALSSSPWRDRRRPR